MLKFTLQDGTTLKIASTAVLMTNQGPMQASEVTTGTYVRCGTVLFCRVDDIAAL